jgi:hypothetical protein
MHDREAIARLYGFESFTCLLEISTPLPMGDSDDFQCYVACQPNGPWFVWQDREVSADDTVHD